jgi:hypothetical protein
VADKLVGSSRATEKIVWGLSLKIIQDDTIDIEGLDWRSESPVSGWRGSGVDAQPGRRDCSV